MEQICRACRESTAPLVDIFDDLYQQTKDAPSLAEMLSELAACEVRRNDPLPQQMCLPCVLAAQNAFRFKRKCEQSHRHFWDLLSGNVKLEENPSALPDNCTPAIETRMTAESTPAPGDNSTHNCQTCGKGFDTKRKLMLHQSFHDRTQAGERTYKCSFCEKNFNGNWWLQRHLRTHTEERPYKCSHCEKAFKDSWSLRRHMRTHLGEFSYKCIYCPKTFSTAARQRIHICTHTGDYPYKCKQTQGDPLANRSKCCQTEGKICRSICLKQE
ncbi:hypothetical protein ACLKA7_015464 [Drosophila subpalustris]